MLEDGAAYGGVTVSAHPAQTEEDEYSLRFVALESEVLLHHSAETLLRLYLAHEGLPPCPWMELARLRAPRDFKEKIRDRFEHGPSLENSIELSAPVFFGARPLDDELRDVAMNLEQTLRLLAGHLLRYPHLYNAAKHGFGVHATDTGTRLSMPENPEISDLETSGPAIQYLTARDDEDRRRWYEAMTFVEPARAMAQIGVASLMIRNLWDVARHRYSEGDTPEVLMLTEPVSSQLRRSPGLMIRSVRRQLVYGDETQAIWQLEVEWRDE